MTREDLISIIGKLIHWAWMVNGSQGAKDAMNAAQMTNEEIKELGLEEYLEEDEEDEY